MAQIQVIFLEFVEFLLKFKGFVPGVDVLDFDFLRLLLELFVDEFLLGEEGFHVGYCYLFDLELLFEFGVLEF